MRAHGERSAPPQIGASPFVQIHSNRFAAPVCASVQCDRSCPVRDYILPRAAHSTTKHPDVRAKAKSANQVVDIHSQIQHMVSETWHYYTSCARSKVARLVIRVSSVVYSIPAGKIVSYIHSPYVLVRRLRSCVEHMCVLIRVLLYMTACGSRFFGAVNISNRTAPSRWRRNEISRGRVAPTKQRPRWCIRRSTLDRDGCSTRLSAQQFAFYSIYTADPIYIYIIYKSSASTGTVIARALPRSLWCDCRAVQARKHAFSS